MRIPKFAALFAALLLGVFMASTAMAIQVTNRSAEMDDFSTCDRAGTIEMRLTQADWTLIENYLATHDYALIRIALNGDNLPASPSLPILCEDIHGGVDGAGLGAQGGDLPYTDLVELDEIDVEISDVDAAGPDGTPDLTVYVHGDAGDQFLEVFITALDGVIGDFDFTTTTPWLKIGLYDELDLAGGQENTSICADVRSFSGISRLTISNEALPNTITFSGDNEIGHFLTMTTAVRDCTKNEQGEGCVCDTEIELCPLGGTEQAPECPTYSNCFVVYGDVPVAGDIEISIRTNGAATGDNTQEGIYFSAISLSDENGDAIVPTTGWVYYTADGSVVTGMPCDYWEAEYAVATIDAADVSDQGNEVRFCVTYAVNPDEAQANTDVMFWINLAQLPCGSIFSGTDTGASLIECNPGSYSMYFPYVVTQNEFWQTGIAITNLSTTVAAADMEATLTLTDSTGATFTYTKTDFTQVVWATMLDSILSSFSGTPAAGAAWLKVDTNFSVDGYEYMTDGVFGAGTSPRIEEGNGWE